ncbi:hypothetical protein [Sphingobacterium corticibacter]|uniref:Uncharacterized protein n=1 Tax=Sphingobacterium corticibacter TaxID=2171749 RepID=A0A2T8HNP5_9SPHI|nr:hypothetical protein [Sphingobacterium corticibacter]PVH27035.1 hypothetical protein DC487_05410 [Sphingobacterium corticibacter]
MTTTLIEKEEIEQYKFVPAEVDRTKEFASKLSDALRLGNEFKSKTAMTFMTEDGPKRVETTVWSLTEKYIVLKASVLIPMRSLIDISY